MAALANIRHVERNYLRSLLLPGHLVQVSGPPMIGKLTVVNQVLKDLELSSRLQGSLHLSLQPGPFIYHRFSCKHASVGQAVLRNIAVNLMRPLPDTQDLGFLTTTVLSDLKSVVQLTDDQLQTRCHHIFVFEKCESLVTHDSDHWFLCFVSALMQELASHLVTVVFTSYKRFEWSGFHPDRRDTMVIGPVQDGDGNLCFTLEIEQLKDTDILCLLQHFAPAVDPSPYLHVFQRFLGFPEAVRKVAQTFLIASATGNGGAALSSSSLDNLVKTDFAFLHSVFSSRLDEVMDWVGWENLLILRHLGSCMESSATEECFKSVAAGDLDYGRWTCLSYMLHRFYIIRKLPGVQRLVVHPLVIYFCWTQLRAILVALRGQETNLFSNRFTHFLCATLSNLDACSTLKGRQLAVVTNMLYECPNIRHVISMALLASEDSYGVYLKLAISGGGMLSLLCPREVITFFACLYKRSKVCGRGLIERAILRGLYGQALAWGTGTGSFGRASGNPITTVTVTRRCRLQALPTYIFPCSPARSLAADSMTDQTYPWRPTLLQAKPILGG
ncbi:hypothetical protein RRG08_016380 [Elysia crispata]|uniref:Uncharacterized protein n=1 Tax=Elysia crispata TaxID=231223 RepID=A0AAE1E8P9_9GAST|nr:hypothetical protein RRG08_016380 [Elysia crispata]